MATWQDTYSQALQDRDEQESTSCSRINSEYLAAYTSLLDHNAHLGAQVAALTSGTFLAGSGPPEARIANSQPETQNVQQLRVDLAESVRANTQLSARLKTAESLVIKLRSQVQADAKKLESLTRHNVMLERKMKDKIEELRGKTRGYGDVQDEMISLNLQLNLAEQKAEKLAADNQELIDRWMARKGQEADAMNEHFARGG